MDRRGLLPVKSVGANAANVSGIRLASDLAIVLLESTTLAAGRFLLWVRFGRCWSEFGQPAEYDGRHQEPEQWSNERVLVSVEKLQHMRPNEGEMCSNNFHDLSPIDGNEMRHCGLQFSPVKIQIVFANGTEEFHIVFANGTENIADT